MVLGWESKNEGFLNGGVTTAFMLMGMLSFLYLKNAFGIGFWFALAFAPTTTLSKGTLWSVVTYLLLCGIIVFFLFDFTFGGQVNTWTFDALGYRISWDEFRSGITAGLGAGFVWILVNNKGLRGMFKRREYSAKNKERKAGINPDWKKDEKLVMDFDYDYLIFQDLARIVYVLSLHFTKNKEDFREVLNSFNSLGLNPGELFNDCKSVTKLKLKESYSKESNWKKALIKSFNHLTDVAGSLVSMNEAQEKKIGKRLKELSAYEERPELKPYIDQYNLNVVVKTLNKFARRESLIVKRIKKIISELIDKIDKEGLGKGLLLSEANIMLQINYYLLLQLKEMYYLLWAEQAENKILSSASPGEAAEINFDELNNKLKSISNNYSALWKHVGFVINKVKSKLDKEHRDRIDNLMVSSELLNEQDINRLLSQVEDRVEKTNSEMEKLEDDNSKELREALDKLEEEPIPVVNYESEKAMGGG